MFCPLCAAPVPVQQTDCLSCGSGLAEYAAVWYTPDQLFNEGIAAIHRGQYAEAATRFAQVCWFRADDDTARRAWAHACTRLGRHEEALGILLDIRELAVRPEADEQYALVLAALEDGQAICQTTGRETSPPQRAQPPVDPGTRRKRTSRYRKRHG
jgi:hypothetical protein